MRNSLLRNDGDGTFTDVTQGRPAWPTASSRRTRRRGPTTTTTAGSISTSATSWRRAGSIATRRRHVRGRVGQGRRRAATPSPRASTWGDYDNDGFPDLYASNMFGDNFLYHNKGDGTFDEVAAKLGVQQPLASFPTWWFDYDNDGWLDLFVVAYPNSVEEFVKHYLGQPPAAETLKLYRNDGRRRLHRRVGGDGPGARRAGDGRQRRRHRQRRLPRRLSRHRRAVVRVADPEHPAAQRRRPALRRRHRGHRHRAPAEGPRRRLRRPRRRRRPGHRAERRRGGARRPLRRRGVREPRHAGPALGRPASDRPPVEPGRDRREDPRHRGSRAGGRGAATRLRYREVSSGGSFGSNSYVQHVGLGAATGIESIEIVWPASKTTQVFRNPPIDTLLEIREGADAPVVRPQTGRSVCAATAARPRPPALTTSTDRSGSGRYNRSVTVVLAAILAALSQALGLAGPRPNPRQSQGPIIPKAPDADALLAQAVQLHEAGDIFGAVTNYEAYLKTNPDNAGARSNLGAAYVRLGRLAGGHRRVPQGAGARPGEPDLSLQPGARPLQGRPVSRGGDRAAGDDRRRAPAPRGARCSSATATCARAASRTSSICWRRGRRRTAPIAASPTCWAARSSRPTASTTASALIETHLQGRRQRRGPPADGLGAPARRRRSGGADRAAQGRRAQPAAAGGQRPARPRPAPQRRARSGAAGVPARARDQPRRLQRQPAGQRAEEARPAVRRGARSTSSARCGCAPTTCRRASRWPASTSRRARTKRRASCSRPSSRPSRSTRRRARSSRWSTTG